MDFDYNQTIIKTINFDWDNLALQADFFKSPMTKNLALLTMSNGNVVI